MGNSESQPPGRKKRWRWVLGILLFLGAVIVFLHWPVPAKLTISPETTVVTEPLNPDGTPNYVAALDALAAKGVTKENNAAIPLLQALGSGMLPQDTRYEILHRLDVPPLPEPDECFITVGKWGGKAQEQALREELADATEFPWARKDRPTIAKWLDANAKPLELVAAAGKRDRYYLPMLSPSEPPAMIHVLLPEMRVVREAALALLGRGMRKLHEGHVESAWSDILAAHRLGRLVSQPPSLINNLLGIGIRARAGQAGSTLAGSGKLTPAQARAMLADLSALPPGGDVVDSIDRNERFMMLDWFMMVSRGVDIAQMLVGISQYQPDSYWAPPSGKRPRLDYDVMLQIANRCYDRVVCACREASHRERTQALDKWTKDIVEMKGRSFRPGARARTFLLRLGGWPCRKARSRELGRALVWMLMPTLGRSRTLQDVAKTRFDLERIALALAAYRAEKGRWPQELKELSPEYLKEVPNDRFTGKPLVYQPTADGYLLYSLGENMIDDGGRDRSQHEDADDIVVRVPPPTKASSPKPPTRPAARLLFPPPARNWQMPTRDR